MRKLHELWESIWDCLFMRALILCALLLLVAIICVEKFLPRELTSMTPDQYRDYARRHAVKAWFLKWPLRLVAM
jgi:protein-S-isoprenylcysteine O-methyltransferase Ste14